MNCFGFFFKLWKIKLDVYVFNLCGSVLVRIYLWID